MEVEAAFGGGADIEMNKVAEGRLRLRIRKRSGGISSRRQSIRGRVRSEGRFDDGSSGVAALADEGFGAGFHAGEVVGDEEELDSRFVGILDHDLELALLRDPVAAAKGGFGGGRASFSFLTFTEGEVHGGAVVFVAAFEVSVGIMLVWPRCASVFAVAFLLDFGW